MAGRRRLTPRAEEGPLVYTAQDVADFCEVDLKTIHHWADAGKIPHHRTEGRHLRFRRNHVVRFLRAHGYPLPGALANARPRILYAEKDAARAEELAKKLASRFAVDRFESALIAIANMVATEADALILSVDDPTWTAAIAVPALKADPSTEWPLLAVLTSGPVTDLGVDLVIATGDVARLPGELSRALGID